MIRRDDSLVFTVAVRRILIQETNKFADPAKKKVKRTSHWSSPSPRSFHYDSHHECLRGKEGKAEDLFIECIDRSPSIMYICQNPFREMNRLLASERTSFHFYLLSFSFFFLFTARFKYLLCTTPWITIFFSFFPFSKIIFLHSSLNCWFFYANTKRID